MLKRNFCWIVIAVFMLSQTAFAEGINLETVYPYSLEHKNIYKTVGSATVSNAITDMYPSIIAQVQIKDAFLPKAL